MSEILLRMFEWLMKRFLLLWSLALIAALTFWVALGYVIIHFLRKYW